LETFIENGIRDQIMAAVHDRIQQNQYYLDHPNEACQPPPLVRGLRSSTVENAANYCLQHGIDMVQISYRLPSRVYVVRYGDAVYEVHHKSDTDGTNPEGIYCALRCS
jgi:hypothetical protein